MPPLLVAEMDTDDLDQSPLDGVRGENRGQTSAGGGRSMGLHVTGAWD